MQAEKNSSENIRNDWAELVNEGRAELLPEAGSYSLDWLRQEFGNQTLAVLDFPVTGLDKDLSAADNLARYGILNIDHHSDNPEMEKRVSTTNLVMEWIGKNGSLPPDCRCLVHHTDADSVLSLAIAAGILEPDDIYGQAAIAADHTGQANDIADLLQAVQDKRDIEYSLGQLRLLRAGKELDSQPGGAKELLEKRRADRQKVREMVVANEFKEIGGVTYAVLDKKIEGELVPAQLPDAKLILLFSPHEDDPENKWEIKYRLGLGAPEGFNLNKIDIKKNIDPNFGGRWNAGSNKRNGGLDKKIKPEDHAAKLAALLENFSTQA